LFAAYQGEVYRIDRHPVMSRHPVTPMNEADLRVHLGKQSALTTGLIDAAALKAQDYAARSDGLLNRHDGGVLIDVLDAETQCRAGEIIWQNKNPEGWFIAGSSGVEYALIAHWRTQGLLMNTPSFAPPGKVDRIAVVSGSLSPMTETQIADAAEHGFAAVAIDGSRFAGDRAEGAINAALTKAEEALRRGLSPLIHTQSGARQAADGSQHTRLRQRIGWALGQILRQLIERNGLTRVAIAGGDTSGHVCEELKIEALTIRIPIAGSPGAPLCEAHGFTKIPGGLQIALKGGQLGSKTYFRDVRDGL
jgi:3-oxoisoapionate kinase